MECTVEREETENNQVYHPLVGKAMKKSRIRNTEHIF